MRRHRIFVAALAAVLCTACDSSMPVEHSTPAPSPTACAIETELCTGAQEAAKELVDANSACKVDKDCQVITPSEVTIPCSFQFQCPFALNKSTDLDTFKAQAQKLKEAAETCKTCGLPCPMPTCVPTESIVAKCQPKTGHCGIGLK